MQYNEEFLKQNIGKNVKALRAKLNLTQEEFAAKMGVEPRTLSRIETGAVFISAYMLSKLSNTTKIQPHEFFQFGTTMECKTDKDKLFAINQILSTKDSKTLDLIYKMVKALSE